MSNTPAYSSVPGKVAELRLKTLTPGLRSLSWLLGQSDYLWLDRLSGRMMARIARVAQIDTTAAWPAPIAPRATTRQPPLAWFSFALGEHTARDWIRAFDTALSQSCDAEAFAPALERLRALHALDPIDRPARAASGLATGRADDVRVLLIDERASVRAGDMSRSQRRKAFRDMVEAAREAHPGATFWLARSCAQGAGPWLSETARGVLPAELRSISEDEDASLCASIDHAAHVYTVAAPEGMHALLAGVPIYVFGTPYYAGWGLSRDARSFAQRRARPTLTQFCAVLFGSFTHYLDPLTHARGTVDALLDAIEIQRSVTTQFAGIPRVAGVRFQWWKRHFATPFLAAGGARLRWTRNAAALADGECAALWGARSTNGLPHGTRVLRMEDGFLHSHGLGSDMSKPRSQVVDTRGLYFDASRPSDLSMLLNEASFDDAELARAAALREQIVRHGLTKYNLGCRRPAWRAPAGKTVVLVPGQVADDASIRLGTRAISTADALLREVRALRPDAWIVYKPHPDVLSGNRRGLVDAQGLADVVDTASDLISLIDAADEVHTLSSLSGFEALLRGKRVHTYGLPFYAGWGLTCDALAPVPWRARTLTLDMLTAGVLLRYPLYWDWRLRLFTTPERIVQELAPLAARPLLPPGADRWRLPRKVTRWSHNVLRHALWRLQS